MALVRTVTHECDRCMFGRVNPATHIGVEFTLNGRRYKGDLCDEHEAMMQRDFGPWRKTFTVVEEVAEVADLDTKRTSAAARTFVTTEHVARSRRAAELRALEAARIQEATDSAQKQLQAEALEIFRLKRTIPGARSWTLSSHARTRMHERNFGPEEVLRTVAAPQVNYPHPDGNGRYIYVRDDCRAVVDPRGKVVITVIDRNDSWDVRPGAERIAQ